MQLRLEAMIINDAMLLLPPQHCRIHPDCIGDFVTLGFVGSGPKGRRPSLASTRGPSFTVTGRKFE